MSLARGRQCFNLISRIHISSEWLFFYFIFGEKQNSSKCFDQLLTKFGHAYSQLSNNLTTIVIKELQIWENFKSNVNILLTYAHDFSQIWKAFNIEKHKCDFFWVGGSIAILLFTVQFSFTGLFLLLNISLHFRFTLINLWLSKINPPGQLGQVKTQLSTDFDKICFNVFQLSDNNCNWMIISTSNTTCKRLFICTGNYQWQSYDVTGTSIVQENAGTTLGINYLQPC